MGEVWPQLVSVEKKLLIVNGVKWLFAGGDCCIIVRLLVNNKPYDVPLAHSATDNRVHPERIALELRYALAGALILR